MTEWQDIASAPEGTVLLLKHKDGHVGIGCFRTSDFDGFKLHSESSAWIGTTVYDEGLRVWIESNGPSSDVAWKPFPPEATGQ